MRQLITCRAQPQPAECARTPSDASSATGSHARTHVPGPFSRRAEAKDECDQRRDSRVLERTFLPWMIVLETLPIVAIRTSRLQKRTCVVAGAPWQHEQPSTHAEASNDSLRVTGLA